MSTIPADDEGVASAPADATFEGSERFPVLAAILDEYFAHGDRSSALMKKYHRAGESISEFEGLSDELRDAVRTPQASTPVVNAVLGTALTRAEARSMLSDFRDELLQQGEFAPEYIEEEEREKREERRNSRPTTDELLSYYARREVAIPLLPWFRDHPFPLFYYLGAGVVLLFIGIGLGQVPWPSWMNWLPLLFLVGGVLVAGLAAVAMLLLRGELLNPEPEDEYAARQEFKQQRNERREARADKPSVADRVRSIFR